MALSLVAALLTFVLFPGVVAAQESGVDVAPDTVVIDPDDWSDFQEPSVNPADAGEPSDWGTGGATASDPSLNLFWYDSIRIDYLIHVFPNATKYRTAFYYGNRPVWLPYSSITDQNYVHAKFSMYATNLSGGTAAIPNFSMRLQNRFAVTSGLMIQTHDTHDNDLAWYQELRPSTDPDNPSIYRVEFDPVDVPFLSTNLDSGMGEGVQPSFEVFSIYPQDQGAIAMAEVEMGFFAKTELSTPTATQIYGVDELTSNGLDLVTQLIPAAGIGEFPVSEPSLATITDSASGVTFNTNNVPTNRIAQLERLFYAGADQTQRMRCAPEEQYKIRWHVTSNRPTSVQGWLWLTARTAKFGYSQFLILSGGQGGGSTVDIARQSLPGIGCLNPDDEGGPNAEPNGGWYTMLMPSPLDVDIASDRPGTTIEEKMPLLSVAPGRGEDMVSPYRDIRIHAKAYDTITVGGDWPPYEAAHFTIDRVVIEAFPRIGDGD